jgi:hypothetical protein
MIEQVQKINHEVFTPNCFFLKQQWRGRRINHPHHPWLKCLPIGHTHLEADTMFIALMKNLINVDLIVAN